MKRLIFTLLTILATSPLLRAQEASPETPVRPAYASSVRQYPLVTADAEALPRPELYPELNGISETDTLTAAAPAPVRKQRFLPMRRRIDREIDKLKFAYAGEVALGLTVSYGTLSSDDTDFMLILDNLNLNGSIFTINPSVGYFFRDNMCAGVRFGYTNLSGSLGTANINLGETNDINLAFNNIHLKSNALSVGVFFRSYAGLDSKGTFAFFSEVDLSMKSGSTNFSYQTGDRIKTVNGDQTQLSLGFNPGMAVYIFPNVCGTVSFGLGGLEYSKIKQKDDAGNVIGTRTASKMRFRLNLLNIHIGVTVHLWNKKANKA